MFSALLWGCGGGHDARVTAVLDRADSLLRTSDTAAHSAALRQMVALDTARALQSDEMLRARHALLLAQARYKCYVTEPADSGLIEIARNYYADHHSSSQDHELYTRALIYSGAVSQELGHPKQAMQFYLEAEDTADPNDHFNLGFTNLRIATLYQSQCIVDKYLISKYRQSLKQFNQTPFSHYQIVCMTELGGIYRTINLDSAFYFANQAYDLSLKTGDTIMLSDIQSVLCELYYTKGLYTKCKNTALLLVEKNDIARPFDYYYLALSYAKLGVRDSANIIFNHAPLPQDTPDSVLYYDLESEIMKINGKIGEQISSYKKSVDIAGSTILSLIGDDGMVPLAKLNVYDKKHKKSNIFSSKYIIIIFVLFFLLLFSLFLFLWKRDKKKWQSLVTELYENRNELEDNHTDLLSATKKHEALRALLVQHFRLMDELIKLGDSNPNSKLPQQLKDQICATYSDKNFVTEMRNFVSMHADETLTDFLASCDKILSETENNIVTLTACGFSSPEIALLTNQKDAAYIRVIRHRISKKLKLDIPLEQYLSAHFKL